MPWDHSRSVDSGDPAGNRRWGEIHALASSGTDDIDRAGGLFFGGRAFRLTGHTIVRDRFAVAGRVRSVTGRVGSYGSLASARRLVRSLGTVRTGSGLDLY